MFKPTERGLETERAQNTLRRVGKEVVLERKRQIIAAVGYDNSENGTDEDGPYSEDLLGMLTKANMGLGTQTISDDDLLSRKISIVSYLLCVGIDGEYQRHFVSCSRDMAL